MKQQAAASTTPAKKTKRPGRGQSKARTRPASLEVRVRKLENHLARFRREFAESDIALAAAELRALNERQSHEGLARLRTDLEALRARGIIDAAGNRIRKDLPREMLEEDADVV